VSPARVAVVGAGLIGRRHIEEVQANSSTELAAVVDPAAAGAELAQQANVPVYASLAELLAVERPDGVIIATPNRLHVEHGLQCVQAGVPALVEKPIGDTVEDARRLVEAAEAAEVPLATGHHRQHSPIMAKSRELIQRGVLGTIVAVTGTALFYKPDEYFDVGGGWRRKPGGGPILINLTHEVNSLLSLVGDIVSVQAMTSHAVRGYPVEDTAAIVFRFANGALGTFLLSVDGRIVGIGSFHRADYSDEAELALLVEDAFQRCGLGTELVWHHATRAVAAGVTRFMADILVENLGAIGAIRRAGYGPQPVASIGGVTRVIGPLIPVGQTTD
jgi:predicted dehydrogenase